MAQRILSSMATVLGRMRFSLSAPAALAIPAVLFIAIFAVYPLVAFAVRSVWVKGAFTWSNYLQLFNSNYFGEVLLRTVLTSLIVMAICLVIGYPLAYFINRVSGRAKIILISLVLLPYLTSVLVRVFSWAAMFNMRGPINSMLVALGIYDEPNPLLGFSTAGMLTGLVHVLTPIAVLSMWATMSRIQRGHEITAGALGASPARTFMTVFLPLSRPGVIAGGLVVYVMCLGAYIIPVALGPSNGLLFAQVVADSATIALNWPLAGAMTVIMLFAGIVPFIIVLIIRALMGLRRSVYPLRNRVASRLLFPFLDIFPAAIWVGFTRTVALLVLAFLLLPEIVVVIFSFGPITALTIPPAYVTLDGYATFFADPAWTEPLGRSFVYAGVDALIALVLGGLAAYGLARSSNKIFVVGLGILLFPLILPEIVPALSFYVFASSFGLTGTSLGIILGQAVTAIGLCALISATVIRDIDINLEHASRMSGASKLQTLKLVVAPLALPGLFVGGLYGFLNAFDNLVLPLFIAEGNQTIPVRMFASMADSLNSVIAVVATLLILILLVITGVAVAIMSRSVTRLDLAKVASR